MSRTVRRHESESRAKRRGPIRNKQTRTEQMKSHKQRRPNERAALRKEFKWN